MAEGVGRESRHVSILVLAVAPASRCLLTFLVLDLLDPPMPGSPHFFGLSWEASTLRATS